MFIQIHNRLKPYMEYARDEVYKDSEVYINFMTLVRNWTKSGKVIEPLE